MDNNSTNNSTNNSSNNNPSTPLSPSLIAQNVTAITHQVQADLLASCWYQERLDYTRQRRDRAFELYRNIKFRHYANLLINIGDVEEFLSIPLEYKKLLIESHGSPSFKQIITTRTEDHKKIAKRETDERKELVKYQKVLLSIARSFAAPDKSTERTYREVDLCREFNNSPVAIQIRLRQQLVAVDPEFRDLFLQVLFIANLWGTLESNHLPGE